MARTTRPKKGQAGSGDEFDRPESGPAEAPGSTGPDRSPADEPATDTDATPPEGAATGPAAEVPAPPEPATDVTSEPPPGEGPRDPGPADDAEAPAPAGTEEAPREGPATAAPADGSAADPATDTGAAAPGETHEATGPQGPATSDTATLDAAPEAAPPEPPREPASAAAPPAGPAPTPARGAGFVPLLIGGAIAALLGFAAAWTARQGAGEDVQAALAQQGQRFEEGLAGLGNRLEAVESSAGAPPDLSAVTEQIEALGARIDQLEGQIEGRIGEAVSALDARIAPLERAPEEDGTLAESAIAAWEEELRSLREEIAQQAERMDQIASGAEERLAAAQAESERLRAEAEAQAARAEVRAALAEVIAALEAGTPYAEALGALEQARGEPAPDALAAPADEGVPTMAELREDFPEAARAALSAARAAGYGEEATGLTGFLRNTFDVRSLTPREGTTPDAILSRVSFAVQHGELGPALEEAEALPPPALDAMAEWLDRARTRLAATNAADALGQSLSDSQGG